MKQQSSMGTWLYQQRSQEMKIKKMEHELQYCIETYEVEVKSSASALE